MSQFPILTPVSVLMHFFLSFSLSSVLTKTFIIGKESFLKTVANCYVVAAAAKGRRKKKVAPRMLIEIFSAFLCFKNPLEVSYIFPPAPLLLPCSSAAVAHTHARGMQCKEKKTVESSGRKSFKNLSKSCDYQCICCCNNPMQILTEARFFTALCRCHGRSLTQRHLLLAGDWGAFRVHCHVRQHCAFGFAYPSSTSPRRISRFSG